MHAPMTRRERVLATFKRQPTDRVPLCDLLYNNNEVIRYFTGEDWIHAGNRGSEIHARAVGAFLDMARGVGAGSSRPDGDYPRSGHLSWSDQEGFVHRIKNGLDHGLVKRPFDDYERAVRWFGKHARKRIESLNNLPGELKQANLKEKAREGFLRLNVWLGSDPTVVSLHSNSGLDELRFALGLEWFTYLYADEPELVSEYLENKTRREILVVHAIADPAISPWALLATDIAMKKGLLHSPIWLRREIFLRLKRIVGAYHEHGMYSVFHSDGYLMEVMPDLIACGIDGLNPVEITAGMDVGEMYRLHGNKIVLTRGIDMSQLLSNGSPDEVREVCRKARADAPRGYFMGSTSEIDASARMENVLAMIESFWGYAPTPARI
ncbi:MAG: uroporphyrinogen decarboxylase family protein [Verrucomicrobiae bacterium]|nr:uroporphyrinogen decarboxylase family protein [Verrucomicrobiae bacterium]